MLNLPTRRDFQSLQTLLNRVFVCVECGIPVGSINDRNVPTRCGRCQTKTATHTCSINTYPDCCYPEEKTRSCSLCGRGILNDSNIGVCGQCIVERQ